MFRIYDTLVPIKEEEEEIHTIRRVAVCMHTPILAEDSTYRSLVPSVAAVVEQLGEEAEQNDYLVGLLLVLLAESGFRVSSYLSDAAYYKQSSIKDDERQNAIVNESSSEFPHLECTKELAKPGGSSSQIADDPSEPASDSAEAIDYSLYSRNTRMVYIPRNWKSPLTGVYEIPLVLNNVPNIKAKLIVVPSGNKLFVNMLGEMRGYCMVVKTLKYVNPYPQSYHRYMNLKELSHMFKDALATPIRTDILSSVGLMSPSLQGLPTELQEKIIGMLSAKDVNNLMQCNVRFSHLCSDKRIWKILFAREPHLVNSGTITSPMSLPTNEHSIR